MHSNSLIENLIPLENDAGTCLLDFQCMQQEDSLKIDFYFEVFKQLKDHVLSYLTRTTLHKNTGIY